MFNVTWANQWEPSKKIQHAFDCYNSNFSTGVHINEDIALISDEEMAKTRADMIVGGFPCQDYSVARSLSGELGIQGKKGVLFWQIIRFIQNTYPKYFTRKCRPFIKITVKSKRKRLLLSCYQH